MITKMLQRCYKDVTKMLQRCYKDVTKMLHQMITKNNWLFRAETNYWNIMWMYEEYNMDFFYQILGFFNNFFLWIFDFVKRVKICTWNCGLLKLVMYVRCDFFWRIDPWFFLFHIVFVVKLFFIKTKVLQK